MPILGSFELKTVLSQVGDKQPQEGALEATDILKLLGAAAFIIVQNVFFFFKPRNISSMSGCQEISSMSRCQDPCACCLDTKLSLSHAVKSPVTWLGSLLLCYMQFGVKFSDVLWFSSFFFFFVLVTAVT